MKKNKLITFKVNGKAVEVIEGIDLDLDGIESFKGSVAFMNGVSFDDVEVVTSDVLEPDYSETMMVREDGVVMFRPNKHALFRLLSGVRPAFDISHGELFHEFLDLVQKKDYDNAIIFN